MTYPLTYLVGVMVISDASPVRRILIRAIVVEPITRGRCHGAIPVRVWVKWVISARSAVASAVSRS